jgi:PAS domain S-box-containing protein
MATSRQPLAATDSTTIEQLKGEISLLHSYATDTVYRLRYATMQYEYVSPNVEKLLGFSPDELTAMNFRDLILETRIIHDGMRRVEDFTGLETARKLGETLKWQADYRLRTKDGREIWVSDISYPWLGEDGGIIGSVGSLRDITDRVLAEETLREELVRLANSDALTGLSNRSHFFNRLEQELKLQRRSGNPLSLIVMDIDHFKRINDRYGHPAGDRVLLQVASVMLSCLRETDIAARLGGEECGLL